MDLIDHLISRSLADDWVSAYFPDTFVALRLTQQDASKRGFSLNSHNDQLHFMFTFFRQLEKRTCYVTQYNSRALVFSLRSNESAVTIFFNHYYETFAVVPETICVDEAFMGHPIGTDVNVLQSIGTDRKYLYSDKGEFLEIEAEDIICTKDSFRPAYYRNFAVTKERGKWDIYSDNLEPLVLDADDYSVVGDWYCVSQKNGLKYLSHVSKGNLLQLGFDGICYVRDKYYLHNEKHFFILKHGEGYGLFRLKQGMLFNNFDWDDYRAKDGYDYLYYRRDQQWFMLDFYRFKSIQTDVVNFTERIKE
jgi:hypothetical protein